MRRTVVPILISLPIALGLACAPASTPTTASVPSTAHSPELVRAIAAPTPIGRGDLNDVDRARQALNRLTFGPRPGDLAMVEKMGVDAWIDLQLHPERIPDRTADSVLSLLVTQREKAYQVIADHPDPNELTGRLQVHVLPDSSKTMPSARDSLEYKQAQQAVNALSSEITPAKVLRATLSDRQLLEVMVDFWENHFSVSINKAPSRYAMVEYDRDVIRPYALGRFRDLLGSVAKSPMMLYYLDNYQSQVDSLHPTGVEEMIEARRSAEGAPMGDSSLLRVAANQRRQGLNENYAREIMELHTLGVDGGYTQHDVIEVARCLTGWTIDQPTLGGQFLFRQDLHDFGGKTVLGTQIPAGRGIEDGEQVLDLLAASPHTAHFIARKLVIHFVSDSPPPALVERVAESYLRTGGDIREVMRTLIMSPEFNSHAAYRAKVKTPFELVASALRAMNALPDTTQRSAQLVAQLGQPIFAHLTPEGWPDQGAVWMNSGALLNRVNFATKIGANQIPNVTIAKWKPAEKLEHASPGAQVDGVIAALLLGDVSPNTRQAMLGIQPPPPPINAAQALKHLGELVAFAMGAPEFQHR